MSVSLKFRFLARLISKRVHITLTEVHHYRHRKEVKGFDFMCTQFSPVPTESIHTHKNHLFSRVVLCANTKYKLTFVLLGSILML